MTTPDFDSIYTPFETAMLKDAYNAITKADLWEWMRRKSTPGPDGFMFSSAIELAIINAEMSFDGHSGSSYGWTMRQMESIAKRGWEEHKNQVRRNRAVQQLNEWAKKVRDPSGHPCMCRVRKGYDFGWCGVASGGVPGCEY